MARPKKGADDWEAGFRASIKALSRGWGVSEHNGKVRLRTQTPKGEKYPPPDGKTLDYPWTPASQAAVIQLVSLILEPVNKGQKGLREALFEVQAKSDTKQKDPENWPSIVEAFHMEVTQKRNRIQELTYQRSYGRYFEVALELLAGRKPPLNGCELTGAVLDRERFNKKPGKKYGEALEPWREQAPSCQECCLAIKKLMEFAVYDRSQPESWLIKPPDYQALRGERVDPMSRAVLSDDECEMIFEAMEKEKGEGWANVARIQRVYGIRMWETNYLVVKPNPVRGMREQVFVTKGKTFTSKGAKRTTAPRFLEAIEVNGSDFGLQERIKNGTLEMPVGKKGGSVTISGANLGQRLRELAVWRKLEKERLKIGENLVPYSFRHTYSAKCTEMGIETDDASHTMGHSAAVHQRIYRTATDKSAADAFDRARARQRRS